MDWASRTVWSCTPGLGANGAGAAAGEAAGFAAGEGAGEAAGATAGLGLAAAGAVVGLAAVAAVGLAGGADGVHAASTVAATRTAIQSPCGRRETGAPMVHPRGLNGLLGRRHDAWTRNRPRAARGARPARG